MCRIHDASYTSKTHHISNTWCKLLTVSEDDFFSQYLIWLIFLRISKVPLFAHTAAVASFYESSSGVASLNSDKIKLKR